MTLKFVALVFLWIISSVGPGLFLVRRLRWKSDEKLCAALGLSFCFLYVANFLIFAERWPPDSAYAVSALCLALTAACWGDLRRLARARTIHRQALAFTFLLVYGLILLGMVRIYSGGVCAIDWLEHFFRTRYFLVHPPQSIICGLPLAARPPFMNVVAAHYLAQLGRTPRYEFFQLTFLYLNLLVFFPLCLLWRRFGGRSAKALVFLVGFLMANPLLWWNVTWTWTKVFAAFYVLLALHFYLAGLRRRDSIRIGFAFFFACAGFLVHFSAGPYLLALACHYVVVVLPRRIRRWRAPALTALACGMLLLTWFGYSLATFGAPTTFASNTTARGLGTTSIRPNLTKVAENVAWSLVPHPLRAPRSVFEAQLNQSSRLGYLRDYMLTLYNPNFLLALGSVGWLLVLYLLVQASREPTGLPGRGFWVLFILMSALLGVAAHPTADEFGVAQICGQPLIYLGLAFLAARYFRLPRWLRWLGLAGCALDFGLGVFLHFHIENQTFPMPTSPNASTPYRLTIRGAPAPVRARIDFPLSRWADINWQAKSQEGAVYWGDYLARLPHASAWLHGLVLGLFGLVWLVMIGMAWPSKRQAPSVESPAPKFLPTG